MKTWAFGLSPLFGIAFSLSDFEQCLRIGGLFITLLTGAVGLYYLVKSKRRTSKPHRGHK